MNKKAVKQALSELGMGKVNQKYVIQYDINHNELKRFGSIAECCQYLIDNNLVKTEDLLSYFNAGILWKGYYFEILDN